MIARPSAPAGVVRRARVVLLSAAGASGIAIAIQACCGVLAKQSLSIANFASKHALEDHLRAYLRAWNTNPTPFE